jgi:excisionase family DNA binding protein
MPAVKDKRPSAGIRELVTIREVAKHFDVNVGTIYRWIGRGEFPKPMRFGRRMVRWDVVALNDWIAGGCKPLNQR